MASSPNIILIVADQWRADCINCLQTPHPVMTPHVDQLAAEGTLFTQAYADCPICMPQRATQLTGQVASRFGETRHFPPGVRTPVPLEISLPARLTREAGYQTKAIGKMHFSPERARLGFEHVTLHPNDYVNWLEDCTPYGGMYRGHGLGGNEVYPTVSAVPERYTHTHWIIDESIKFLHQRDPDNPFFLQVVFEAPHSPFDPPEPYDRAYDNFTIPDPVIGEWAAGDAAPPEFLNRRAAGKWNYLRPEVIREARRRYYGQITHIDFQLGRFFGALKSLGLYDNSVIIFTSDHGEHLGDHGMFAKSSFLRGAGDVPMIIRPAASAGDAGRSIRCNTPVLTADLYPTILEMVGLQPRGPVDGISLAPVISGSGMKDRTIFGEIAATAFAFDGRYKFIYYSNGGVELLFDVENDPQELHNRAADPSLAPVLERLRKGLIEYLAGFNRPMVKDGKLVRTEGTHDRRKASMAAPQALRAPLRWGRGY